MLINASGFRTLTVNSTCSQRLGIESGVIKDFQLTATSSLSTFLGPEKFLQARLNLVGGAWCPSKSWSSKLNYLEIDLLDDYVVSSILIQGRYANDGLKNEFATHIMLKFWRKGYTEFLDY